MPDKRHHRGPHPEDAVLFSPLTLPVLRQAVSDTSWLLSHGYAEKSTLKIVGDRYNLNVRQRLAVMRASCSDPQRQNRISKNVQRESAADRALMIDGYNVLITVECALAGGVLLLCRDGSIRDIAGLYGTYRKVEETLPALRLICKSLLRLGVSETVWLLDSPVSNSGRLKAMILELAQSMDLAADVQLVPNPDKPLMASELLIATSDSAVLDACQSWFNLADYIIAPLHPDNVIDLNI